MRMGHVQLAVEPERGCRKIELNIAGWPGGKGRIVVGKTSFGLNGCHRVTHSHSAWRKTHPGKRSGKTAALRNYFSDG